MADLTNIDSGTFTWAAGRSSDLRNLVAPANEKLSAAAAEVGLMVGTSAAPGQSFDIPDGLWPTPSPEDRIPRADLAVGTLVFGIAVFLGTTIGGWAVEKLCDEFYEQKVRPILFGARETVAEEDIAHRKPFARFDHWFDIDRVHVRIEFDLADGRVDSEDFALLPEALRRAKEWVTEKGVTHPAIVYRITKGHISAPRLLDALPS